MSSWFGRWFAYGVGSSVGKALFSETPNRWDDQPIRQQTEAEIQADEKRYDEEAKALDAADARRTKAR